MHLNEELETAISIITTSYLRTEDLIRAVKENLPYINEPVKANFEAFVYEAELINANTTSAINSLKMKIPNRVFHEWANILIQCQSDRAMKNTLPTIAQKFSDVRVVQSELEAMMQGPRREAITMMFLVIANESAFSLDKVWAAFKHNKTKLFCASFLPEFLTGLVSNAITWILTAVFGAIAGIGAYGYYYRPHGYRGDCYRRWCHARIVPGADCIRHGVPYGLWQDAQAPCRWLLGCTLCKRMGR